MRTLNYILIFLAFFFVTYQANGQVGPSASDCKGCQVRSESELQALRDAYEPHIERSNLKMPKSFKNPDVINGAKSELSNKGTEFWLAFNSNHTNLNAGLYLDITSDISTSGMVSVAGIGFSQSYTVTANSITRITVPVGAIVKASQTLQSLGIHVTANDPVTVYGTNQIAFTTDAFLGLPVSILGTQHLAIAYTAGSDLSAASQITIVSPYDNNVITITPSKATLGGNAAGVPFNVSMNTGQTYAVRGQADLTGSVIESTLPISVFSGAGCINIPVGFGYCDHIVQQVPSLSTWGETFVTRPLQGRNNGDTWRFLASQDNTDLLINGTSVATLNFGDFYETMLTVASYVEASNPILAVQYSNGNTWDGNSYLGDPFMMIIPPYQQFLEGYTFSTPAAGFINNYFTSTVENDGVAGMMLNGAPLNAASYSGIPTTLFSAGAFPIGINVTNNLSNANSYASGLYVYGFNADDSYGYPGGLSLLKINEGSGPEIELNSATLDLFCVSNSTTVDLNIEALIIDEEAPFVTEAKLFWRVVGDTDYIEADLTESTGNLWSTTLIADVTEFPGIEFYLWATDGQINATSPLTNPINSPYSIGIDNEPPQIVHTPIVQSPVGVDILVAAAAIDITNNVATVDLYYRVLGGTPFYTIINMANVGDDDYEATIPGAEMTVQGIEYYIKATDDHGVSCTYGSADMPMLITEGSVANPKISVNPLSLSESLYPGETSTQTLTISNNGNSDLTVDLADLETSKRMKIKSVKPKSGSGDNSGDFLNYLNRRIAESAKSGKLIDWLTEAPLAGVIAPGQSLEIEVTFDATALTADIYSAQILINGNDPATPQVVVPVTLQVKPANCTFIITDDNENNALAGVPDYDMDVYLFKYDYRAPIEFNIFVPDQAIEMAQLNLYAWDVDEYQGEIDEVYVNGTLVGTLTGADDEWSTTVFNLDPSLINTGKNLIQIFIDVNTNGNWAVNVDWGQLIICNMDGSAYIRYAELDNTVYPQGANVQLTVEVDTDLETQNVIIETNLLDENNINVAGTSNTRTISLVQDEPLTVTLAIPANATLGANYHAQVIVYDAATYVQQDLALVPFIIWDEQGFLNCLDPGWQLISSPYYASDPDLDVLMADVNASGALVIMLNKYGIYWPVSNINMLGDWDNNLGYKIKMALAGCINWDGDEVMDKTVNFTSGIDYLPVLSTAPVAAADIFDQIEGELVYAFDIVNGLIYWPNGGIFTLQILEPGKAYLLNMMSPGSITYPFVKQTSQSPVIELPAIENAPYTVIKTGGAHFISVRNEALRNFNGGDIVAAFNQQGTCVGMAQYNSDKQPLVLAVYADDFTTEAIDGMSEGELMQLVVYSPTTLQQKTLQPVWNTTLSHSDLFAENALSEVVDFKESALGIDGDALDQIRVYPNPSAGIFNITGVNDGVQLEILNAVGQQVQLLEANGSVQIDLSGASKGIYYLRMISQQSTRIQKIVVN